MTTVAILVVSTVLSVVLTGHLTCAEPFNQQVILYDGYGCQGDWINLAPPVANLTDLGWNDYAYSVAVRGAWLFYDNSHYNKGSDAAMEYIYSPNTSCKDFDYVREVLTSVRLVGDENNYRNNSFTLYKNKYFQDVEEITFRNNPNIHLDKHASLILTGVTPWTLYDEQHYHGNSVCLYPNSSDFAPYFVYDLQKNLNIPYNSIRSVRLGCFGKKANGTGFLSTPEGHFNGI